MLHSYHFSAFSVAQTLYPPITQPAGRKQSPQQLSYAPPQPLPSPAILYGITTPAQNIVFFYTINVYESIWFYFKPDIIFSLSSNIFKETPRGSIRTRRKHKVSAEPHHGIPRLISFPGGIPVKIKIIMHL